MCNDLREDEGNNQWKITRAGINWFKSIKCDIVQFYIMEFYPDIIEYISNRTID